MYDRSDQIVDSDVKPLLMFNLYGIVRFGYWPSDVESVRNSVQAQFLVLCFAVASRENEISEANRVCD